MYTAMPPVAILPERADGELYVFATSWPGTWHPSWHPYTWLAKAQRNNAAFDVGPIMIYLFKRV